MADVDEVAELDAALDRALAHRVPGPRVLDPSSSLIEALVALDDLEWPDRELGSRIFAGLFPVEGSEDGAGSIQGVRDHGARSGHRWTRRTVALGLLGIAATLAVILALTISPPRTQQAVGKGTWRLAGYYSPPGWKQSGLGGPAGPLTCPTATTCYLVNSEQVHSSSPLSGFTLFALSVSHNRGATWNDLPLKGLSSFTTAIQCPSGDAEVCFAGGLQGSRPVLLFTRDGGKAWTGQPLPDHGQLESLSCTSRSHCVGVIGPGVSALVGTGDVYVTENGGRSWAAARTGGTAVGSITCTGSTCAGVGAAADSDQGPPALSGIETSQDGDVSVLRLVVDEADKGKVIGKQGKVIKAIRAVVGAAAAKAGHQVEVEID